MRKNLITQFVLALLIVTSITVNAQHESEAHNTNHKEEAHQSSDGGVKAEIKEVINHHLLDDHDFTITHGVSFPLPIILWDNGLQVFMSSLKTHSNVSPVCGEGFNTPRKYKDEDT